MSMEAPDYHKEHLKNKRGSSGKLNRRAWFLNSAKFLLPPLVCGAYARYESGWFELTRTQIGLPQLPQNKRIKILHLSDLHLSSVVSTEHIDLALAEGFQNAPHVCVITGDFVTDQPGKEELLALEKEQNFSLNLIISSLPLSILIITIKGEIKIVNDSKS